MKIFDVVDVEDDIKKTIEKENTTHRSSEGHFYLFQDDDVFERIDKQFNLSDYENIIYDDLKSFMEVKYEEKISVYLGICTYYIDYIEGAINTIECMIKKGKFDFSKWESDIEKYLEENIKISFKKRFEDGLKNMVRDGVDLEFIENSVKEVIDETSSIKRIEKIINHKS